MGIASKIGDYLFGEEERPADAPDAAKSSCVAAETISIIVDHREQAGGFADELERLSDRFAISRAVLPVGDVVIGGRIGIERKRADDFVASMKDGRLFHQAASLAEAFAERALIVEGPFTADGVRGMGSDQIRGAMVSLQFDWGTHVLRSRDVKESADYIAILAARLGRRRVGRKGPAPNAPAKLTAQELADGNPVEAVLVALPGMGASRAKEIARHWPDFPSLMLATPKDFARVEGIGPVMAARLHAMLHGGPGRG